MNNKTGSNYAHVQREIKRGYARLHDAAPVIKARDLEQREAIKRVLKENRRQFTAAQVMAFINTQGGKF